MKLVSRLLAVPALLLCLSSPSMAQTAPEVSEVHVAVAGLGFPYLPFIIAQQRGYFKAQGLTVDMSVFSGGSQALQALLGGSADVAAGGYSSTIQMAVKGQPLVTFAVQANCAGWVFGVTKAAHDSIKSFSDLKGKRIGVSAPGSGFHMGVNFLLNKVGIKPDEVSIIGVGVSATAVSAARGGMIDALMTNDPSATMLQDSGDLFPLAEMRNTEGNQKAFGGNYAEASLFATKKFVDANPNTVQALTNAMVDAEQWLAKATPEEVAANVPPDYFVKDNALFVKAFSNMRHCISTNAVLEPSAAQTVRNVLAAFDPAIANSNIDLSKTYDNSFAERANKR